MHGNMDVITRNNEMPVTETEVYQVVSIMLLQPEQQSAYIYGSSIFHELIYGRKKRGGNIGNDLLVSV